MGLKEDAMTDLMLDMRNEAALSRAHSRFLQPPMEQEKEPCDVCNGVGVIPGTETEDLYGDPCPKGCPLNRDAFPKRTDLPRDGGI